MSKLEELEQTAADQWTSAMIDGLNNLDKRGDDVSRIDVIAFKEIAAESWAKYQLAKTLIKDHKHINDEEE
jgi:hypothetical protein